MQRLWRSHKRGNLVLQKPVIPEDDAEQDRKLSIGQKGFVAIIHDTDVLSAIVSFRSLRVRQMFLQDSMTDVVDIGIMQGDFQKQISIIDERMSDVERKMDLLLKAMKIEDPGRKSTSESEVQMEQSVFRPKNISQLSRNSSVTIKNTVPVNTTQKISRLSGCQNDISKFYLTQKSMSTDEYPVKLDKSTLSVTHCEPEDTSDIFSSDSTSEIDTKRLLKKSSSYTVHQ